MTLLQLLAFVVDALDEAGVPHMVAGSFASTYHGEPRMTQDIDFVIDPTDVTLQRLVGRLEPPRFYVGDARSAFERRDQFNVIDTTSAWKVDLIIRKDRPFSREEFSRRMPVELGGVRTFVATPEDTILAKLEWGQAARSERQRRDVVGVLEVAGPSLDRDYLWRWAAELGVSDELESVLAEAGLAAS